MVVWTATGATIAFAVWVTKTADPVFGFFFPVMLGFFD